jgi:hypothetical protein
MSVSQAAGAAGISNTSWGEWERGKRTLSDGVRMAVAQTFDWPTTWDQAPPPVADLPTGSVSAVEVMARLDAIDEKINRLAGLPDAVGELVLSIHSLLSSELEEEQLQGGGRPEVERRRTGSSS